MYVPEPTKLTFMYLYITRHAQTSCNSNIFVEAVASAEAYATALAALCRHPCVPWQLSTMGTYCAARRSSWNSRGLCRGKELTMSLRSFPLASLSPGVCWKVPQRFPHGLGEQGQAQSCFQKSLIKAYALNHIGILFLVWDVSLNYGLLEALGGRLHLC